MQQASIPELHELIYHFPPIQAARLQLKCLGPDRERRQGGASSCRLESTTFTLMVDRGARGATVYVYLIRAEHP